ncbi:FAD-binding domain-containing protein [Hypoxylon sp. FL0543]|nr:FAD-binding domain-containing protein [Hypoxylon sp. FL0543]
MKFLATLACSIAVVRRVEASPVSSVLHPTRGTVSSATVSSELGASLSNGTMIYGLGTAEFDTLTHRWGTFAAPQVQVVIEPAAESDVSKIVQYSNKNGIEFIAYSGGHGTPKSLATFNGIQINMNKLTSVSIQPDGKSVWAQGGTLAGQANSYLWDKGYVVTTGSCNCVSLAGAGLGGGHGPLEGFYGLVTDNILQLNVVLADGSAVRASATENSDLFWAMRGAGHNFGIVTSMQLKINPRGPLTWLYKNYFWAGDQLETVFEALNNLHGNGTTPTIMAYNVGNIMVSPNISTTEPVLFWQFAIRGTAEEAAEYIAPFDAIPAVSSTSTNVPYYEIAHTSFTGVDDVACTSTLDRVLNTAGLQVWNITAERQIYDSFKKRLAERPDYYSGALLIHEGYATKAVTEIDPNSTAYPFREDHHLTQFQGNLPANSTEVGPMQDWGKEVLDLWNGGQPDRLPDAYVNYASGFESLQEIYGHEPWRISKLLDAKKKYDPLNRFKYYNPLV